jgi:hypothetical protein
MELRKGPRKQLRKGTEERRRGLRKGTEEATEERD